MARGRKPKNKIEEVKENTEVIVEEAPAPKKRGRKKKEETEVSAAPVVKEITEAPKKRGRKPKAAAETVPPVELAAIDEVKPKKRGRKPAAAEKISVPEVTAISEEAAPKKRGRKPKAAAEAVPDVELTAIDEAPKKRGRKPAAAKAEKPAKAVKKASEKKSEAKTAEKKKPGRKPKKAAESKAVEVIPELSPFDRVFHAACEKIEKSSPTEYFAAEVTLTGEVNGKFYVNCTANGMDIAPYDYQGADLTVTVDSETFEDIIAGKSYLNDAISFKKLEMEGRASVMFAFAKLIV